MPQYQIECHRDQLDASTHFICPTSTLDDALSAMLSLRDQPWDSISIAEVPAQQATQRHVLAYGWIQKRRS